MPWAIPSTWRNRPLGLPEPRSRHPGAAWRSRQSSRQPHARRLVRVRARARVRVGVGVRVRVRFRVRAASVTDLEEDDEHQRGGDNGEGGPQIDAAAVRQQGLDLCWRELSGYATRRACRADAGTEQHEA